MIQRITTGDPAGAMLDAALARAFDALRAGVADHRSTFRTPVLATIGMGGAPALRTVVLRGFDPAARCLHIHTDRRSPKFAQLAADGRAALHGYDPQSRLQLCLHGHAVLHVGDAAADAAWTASRETSRMTYAGTHPPGTPLRAPPVAPTDAAAGRAQFGLVSFTFDALDWLMLDPAGNRRACFAWAADGTLTATWIAP
ncbi:pyridoxamine 5'-phosphate oxidase [Roseomonas terrae]|jgi:pyridoxamine 5'-phosphate oxidase|uniref:Pyridoxamine 5'-phosphate oxidase n=1 Tax=Neoroseomonas terrae TaxID=424799 RepID=A0ABS5EEY2_9PROT|nr:pyridoxamine 5'-phosphate oxidase family protein [Neoroseomonas terrae]MBR0649574.1 pyridoxamine 5'-phosphate oxidase [Neoroseomonas terrae]